MSFSLFIFYKGYGLNNFGGNRGGFSGGGGFRPRPPRPGGGSGGGFNRRFPRPQHQNKHRINDHIRAHEVRVIIDGGEQLGIMPTRAAIDKAAELGLDLVEVAETAKPPVCKIMDYGKFLYQEQKKEAKAKKNRTEVETKELRIRYQTDVGDMAIKEKHAREFLAEGHKVKFTMQFKGREAMYAELGEGKLRTLIENLKDVAIVEFPENLVFRLAGKQLFVIFAPAKAGQGHPKKQAEQIQKPA